MKDILSNGEIIKQGAEGRIYKSVYKGKPCIVKERFPKKYRHPDLDKQLTKSRTRSEVKILKRCKSFINVPIVYEVSSEHGCIVMEFIENAITAKEFLMNASEEHAALICKEIGRLIAKLHMNRIIHGDLTTSNILVIDPQSENETDGPIVYLIDFGLSQQEGKIEDKGVDLYVLERALLSTHTGGDQLFSHIFESYQSEYGSCQDVVKKFIEVRARGRKRTMVG